MKRARTATQSADFPAYWRPRLASALARAHVGRVGKDRVAENAEVRVASSSSSSKAPPPTPPLIGRKRRTSVNAAMARRRVV